MSAEIRSPAAFAPSSSSCTLSVSSSMAREKTANFSASFMSALLGDGCVETSIVGQGRAGTHFIEEPANG